MTSDDFHTFFYFVISLISVLIFIYHRVKLPIFSAGLLGILLIGSALGKINAITWIIFLVIFVPLNIPALRYRLLSGPCLKAVKDKLPALSQTEKESINAGTVWWDAELFSGAPNWQLLQATPPPRLSNEEQAFIEGPVNKLCAMVNDFEITHERADLPPAIWQFLKDHGFFAMIIKKSYGGLAFSAYAQSVVLQKLAGVSTVLSTTVGVPNSLGPGELLQHYGTEEQKNYYLPRLAKGIEIPCFALTSPEAGSDASAIPDEGIVMKGMWQGKEILGMSLTWKKRYITLAPIATVLGLAFKLKDPNKLLGNKTELGITCALIPTELEGIKIGRRHFPLNMPFQNGPTEAKDLFVPLDFIIGGEKMAGQGWHMLMECLSVGRAITLPSMSTGSLKSAAVATGAYARIRRQFKLPIGKMEGIEAPLARLAASAYLMDAASTLTVSAIDMGEKPAVISAIIKYHCTQKGREGFIDAMDIAGGKGICLGKHNFLARGYQGAPIGITVEGANILTRSLIIFGQGSLRCHPYLLTEIKAASSQNLSRFDKALKSHLGFILSNTLRSLWLGITDGRTSCKPVHNALSRYYQYINRYSAAFALLADLSMLFLGGKFKRKERLSARLGDILSELYLASAILKRFFDEGEQKADLPLAIWGLQTALYRTEVAMNDFIANFPNKLFAIFINFLVFPLGKRRKKPSDLLEQKCARLLQIPSKTRERLARNQFLTPCKNNPAGNIEKALKEILLAEPIYKKLCKLTGEKLPFMYLDKLANMGLERGLISKEEAQLLISAEQERLNTINVDDFEPNKLAANKVS